MALAAVLLSIFAFIPPIGIAAIVLGHMASRRISASRGFLNGAATARAAIIIGYVQMCLVIVAAGLGWRLLGVIVRDFRHDSLVRRVLRDREAKRTLDYTSAREEESTARGLLIQLVAMQEQYHRKKGGDICALLGC
jgi:hypothetical protein